MDDISKLPKWAQYHIAKLERDLADAQETIQALNSNGQKITWNNTYPHQANGLPDDATITFHLPNDKIDVTLGEDFLRVSGYSNRIHIEPQASNSITIHSQGN